MKKFIKYSGRLVLGLGALLVLAFLTFHFYYGISSDALTFKKFI